MNSSLFFALTTGIELSSGHLCAHIHTLTHSHPLMTEIGTVYIKDITDLFFLCFFDATLFTTLFGPPQYTASNVNT